MVSHDTTILDDTDGLETGHDVFLSPTRTWVLRGAATLSLAVAAVAGALGTGHWLSSHAARGSTHKVVVPQTRRFASQAEPLILTPPPPAHAVLSAGGTNGIADWGWAPASSVTLQVSLVGLRESVPVRAEAEIEPAGLAFTGQPTVSGAPVRLAAQKMSRQPLVFSDLTDGVMYHWRVRTVAMNGHASSWTVGGVFGVSTSAPVTPQLAATNVQVDGWSTAHKLIFRWNPMGSSAPTVGFQYAIVRRGVALGLMHPHWTTISGTVLSVRHWRAGRWELLLRAVDATGQYSRTGIIPFSLAYDAPAIPRIVSASPPANTTSNTSAPALIWTTPAGVAPLRAMQYTILPGAPATAGGAAWADATSSSLHLAGLADGQWTVFVRSVNAIGLASQPVRWSFALDRVRPKLSIPVISTNNFTEPVQQVGMKVMLGKAATVTYRVYQAGHVTPLVTRSLGLRQPGVVHGLNWNGTTTPHHLAPAGTYRVVIDAVDAVGNRTEVQTPLITVQSKRILISVKGDALWAYDGNKLIIHTLVSNGGPDTPTLPGIFHVEAKVPNMVFHSPWPKGSPLYYPPSPTNYAMLYNANGGYFVHDSPWRSNYGPGSNSVAGTPGGNFTGTHGCTNVPLSAMAVIYNWADVGTLVQIVP